MKNIKRNIFLDIVKNKYYFIIFIIILTTFSYFGIFYLKIYCMSVLAFILACNLLACIIDELWLKNKESSHEDFS